MTSFQVTDTMKYLYLLQNIGNTPIIELHKNTFGYLYSFERLIIFNYLYNVEQNHTVATMLSCNILTKIIRVLNLKSKSQLKYTG